LIRQFSVLQKFVGDFCPADKKSTSYLHQAAFNS
jgi:hypothetical protein